MPTPSWLRFLAQRILGGGVVAACLLGVGCAHLPTSGERLASFAPYTEAKIGDETARDFLIDRSGFLFSGTGLVLSAAKSKGVDFKFPPHMDINFGSATAIDPRGYFLTAAHCLGSQPLYLINLNKDGETQFAPARVVWRGEEGQMDLAVLQVTLPIPHIFAWASEFKPGDVVLGAGLNYDKPGKLDGLSPETFAGNIAELSVLNDAPSPGDAIFYHAPIHPGDSGGPLATTDGRLVGINVSMEGVFEFKHQAVRMPFAQRRSKALRPDLAWLRQIIANDVAAHPMSAEH